MEKVQNLRFKLNTQNPTFNIFSRQPTVFYLIDGLRCRSTHPTSLLQAMAQYHQESVDVLDQHLKPHLAHKRKTYDNEGLTYQNR